MNATQKMALERDAFERASFGLPLREFATERERTEFAKGLVERDDARARATQEWLDETDGKQRQEPPARRKTFYTADGKVIESDVDGDGKR